MCKNHTGCKAHCTVDGTCACKEEVTVCLGTDNNFTITTPLRKGESRAAAGRSLQKRIHNHR